MSNMRNLTLASAKHLLTAGHITPAHHARITSTVKMPKMKMPRMVKPRAFGSLIPQQAQAPIPGVGSEPATVPEGTATGYGSSGE